ncbi:aminopeptidase [Iodidimonas gelatinilytica]|uniref:Aminopeptidase n=1 Tax=Iodidimonas gelatinilytica TaxID=1236966 RepID=A0A5A7N2I8_9PROT|nr:M1 family metallopeptidase [Iodidimonas gelatinilytica]GER01286.1 aminopeptidase [Iodidimonas gelatinilytica]
MKAGRILVSLALNAALAFPVFADAVVQSKAGHHDAFRQMEEVWPTPTEVRAASGAPGHEYWQQFVQYDIDVRLDDATRRIEGRAAISYENRSPDPLSYLWLQMDQNRFKRHSVSQESRDDPLGKSIPITRMAEITIIEDGDFGYDIKSITDGKGNALPHSVVDTMMRVDLPTPLMPGETAELVVEYGFNIVSAKHVSNRTAYEILENGSPNYFISMWYPRLAAYTDYAGWIVKAFLYGEPALDFADFDVSIEVPENFTVSATGVLQNPDAVLSRAERDRLEDAKTAQKPVFIITPQEAQDRAVKENGDSRIWHYKAENVRDFAFAASPSFIWDAKGFETADGRTVMAQSLYPPEAEPLWSRYSTEAILQTLETYGRMTMDYPYPHATSINAPIRSGMEYPMLAANAPRPEKDGTYSRRTKYGLIGVVIHEVGHNWFPMIVNSDERHWLWMDEGLNSFLDELTIQEWEEDVPSVRSEPRHLARLMTRPNQQPIMTQSDAYINRGITGYAKVAAALTVLRETVMGREAFDFAFREYAQRWWFKRPMPADFFRTMEDASGIDLDWFWRGWFYSTDHVDISLDQVTRATIDTKNPDVEAAWKRDQKAALPRSITAQRNDGMERRTDREPDLLDFYNEHDEFTVAPKDRKGYEKLMADMEPWEKELLNLGSNLYFLDFSNKGGLVMPLILGIDYEDGSYEEQRIPAQIWQRNQSRVTKLIVTDKVIKKIVLDPHLETADADTSNNYWPGKVDDVRIELQRRKTTPNLMQKMSDDDKQD